MSNKRIVAAIVHSDTEELEVIMSNDIAELSSVWIDGEWLHSLANGTATIVKQEKPPIVHIPLPLPKRK